MFIAEFNDGSVYDMFTSWLTSVCRVPFAEFNICSVFGTFIPERTSWLYGFSFIFIAVVSFRFVMMLGLPSQVYGLLGLSHATYATDNIDSHEPLAGMCAPKRRQTTRLGIIALKSLRVGRERALTIIGLVTSAELPPLALCARDLGSSVNHTTHIFHALTRE